MSRPVLLQILMRPPETAVTARMPSHLTSATYSLASAGSWRIAVASMGSMKAGVFPAACPGIVAPASSAERWGTQLSG